ncbi:hypothetical protein AVEN_225891-1 [Araneus ventricosus]|uniref:Uncharacterized protein n=1 Tax=Araneus ventricosus TaxID=182803 RepID=A0A4Y2BDD1_ARAVE|nr:hypothetical protein AVEN_225891-1 [Araneus ventricosus]
MIMSINACVKRKHHPDFGSFVKVLPEERMANYPVVSPSELADHMCDENSFPPLDSEMCHMPLTRDCRRMQEWFFGDLHQGVLGVIKPGLGIRYGVVLGNAVVNV